MAIELEGSIRLLSPSRRRIYPNAQTGTKMSTAGEIAKQSRRNIRMGVGDVETAQQLLNAGWIYYKGPAATDERGWIVPGTDIAASL